MTTIVIPAYNSRDRISIPLRALVAQAANPKHWELIVIDNASTDGTAEFVEGTRALAQLRDRGVACRVIREPAKGLTRARFRGVAEARGELVCFLDDDCEPHSDYVAVGTNIFDGNEDVALLVSRVVPAFETPPPPAIYRRRHLLAINDYMGDQPVWWPANASIAPTIGAGLWVRLSVFNEAVASVIPSGLIPDRVGDALTSGGDIEIGILIGSRNLRRGFIPTLSLRHHIPTSRFEVGYFLRLIDGTVRSEATLRAKYCINGDRSTRLSAAVRLMLCVLAAPIILLRNDGYRELRFTYADRLARLRGPYRPRNVLGT
jgi:glycosyltransferase involved in cell wall biosynthesis